MPDSEEKPLGLSPSTYSESQIKSLEGVALIRARPSLFIDGLDSDGLHRLVTEAVDNAVDEFSAGWGAEVVVRFHHDGSVEVADFGRGIPLGDHTDINQPTAVVLMTRVFAGAKFDDAAYGSSGGLHGVGLKCINAFSTKVELTTSRPPLSKKFIFENGQIVSCEEGSAETSGLSIQFWPDYAIFPGASLDEERVCARMEDIAFLNPGLTLRFEGRSRSEIYHSESGVPGLLESKGCTNVFSSRDQIGSVSIECHLGETPQGDTLVASYANGIPTPEGGSHLQGAKTGIARAVTAYASRKKMIKDSDPPLSPSDVGEGCLLVVATRSPSPPFSSQRKTRLNSSEIEQACVSCLESSMTNWLESAPPRARRTVQRMLSAARSREKLRALKARLRMLMRAKKNPRPRALMSGGASPAELCLAVKYPSWESISEENRDVLPMRMKQNPPPSRTSLDKLLRHPDYFNLVSTIASGVGSVEDDPEGGFNLEKLKYKRVVITSPPLPAARLAASFALLFMEKNLPGLIESGRVYWCDGQSERRITLSQSIRGELENAQTADAAAPMSDAVVESSEDLGNKSHPDPEPETPPSNEG